MSDCIARHTGRPSVRLFNVKFSPNLGDGLLSECLENALIERGAASDTWSIDLAARTAYGDSMAGRALIMTVLQSLPGPVRGQLVRVPVALKAQQDWRPHYATLLDGADAVVIGGGNLISDIDLNFPTKLTLALEEAEKRGLPAVIYASGVVSGWSATGRRMFRHAFSKDVLKAVFVRDADSKALWDEELAEATGHEARVVRDPGLLASDYYVPPVRDEWRRPVVGLGLMSPIAIQYHAETTITKTMLDRWYVEVAAELVATGYHVVAFTNGSPEDRAYAQALRPALAAVGCAQADQPLQMTPAELCELIASFDAMIAYRMHAIIAAHSYGVPAIGLAWDRKLRSFMASVGREHYFRDLAATEPCVCAGLVEAALREGVPEPERQRVLAEAREGVDQLYDALEAAL